MSDIYQLYGDPSMDDMPQFEKRRRPERCSAKASVRRGLCRAMRQSGSGTTLLNNIRRGTDTDSLGRAA